jgi:anti-sigma-K factor RskA
LGKSTGKKSTGKKYVCGIYNRDLFTLFVPRPRKAERGIWKCRASVRLATILKIAAKMATAMAAIFKSHLSLSHSSGRKSSKYQFSLKL